TKQVSLNVLDGTLQVSDTDLIFDTTQDSDKPPSKSVAIFTPSGIPVPFDVVVDSGVPNSPPPGWLSQTLKSSLTPSRITVSANQSNLPPGSYAGRINLLPSTPGQPVVSIAVTLRIAANPAHLSVSPLYLRFATRVGSPKKVEQFLMVRN